jgi:hypothetical protein
VISHQVSHHFVILVLVFRKEQIKAMSSLIVSELLMQSIDSFAAV